MPLHFLSWHLYSDSPAAHAGNIAKQRARLAKYPQLENVKLFISEWNMDLMNPPLDPRFQPCYTAETIWQMKDANLHVEGVGKRLVHYKLFKGAAKRAPISLSGKEAVAKYLETNKAVLVSS